MTIRTITARRADTCGAEVCAESSRTISAGERINYGGPGAVTHAACDPVEAPRARRSTGRRRGYRTRTRYAYGKCEDAPCCGCCDV
jgi:hypothetical protein